MANIDAEKPVKCVCWGVAWRVDTGAGHKVKCAGTGCQNPCGRVTALYRTKAGSVKKWNAWMATESKKQG